MATLFKWKSTDIHNIKLTVNPHLYIVAYWINSTQILPQPENVGGSYSLLHLAIWSWIMTCWPNALCHNYPTYFQRTCLRCTRVISHCDHTANKQLIGMLLIAIPTVNASRLVNRFHYISVIHLKPNHGYFYLLILSWASLGPYLFTETNNFLDIL